MVTTVITDVNGLSILALPPTVPANTANHVSTSKAALYSLIIDVRKAIASPYKDHTSISISSLYSIASRVLKGQRLLYDIVAYNKVSAAKAAPYNMFSVSRGISAPYVFETVLKVSKAISAEYSYNLKVMNAIASLYSMPSKVVKAVASLYSVLPYNRVLKKNASVYSILGISQVINISDQPYVTVGGVQIPIVSGDVSISEGSFAWECNLTLGDLTAYARFDRDTPFTVNLYGDIYHFLTDGKELSRGAPADVQTRIMGVSPSAAFASPRARLVDYSWVVDAFASSIVSSVSGGEVSWEILDWLIPAYRVAFTRSSPMDVIKKLAEAVGGVVETTRVGYLYVRYKFPISTPDYDTATPDHVLLETTDILSVSENYAYSAVYNLYRVLDVDSSTSDSLQWEPSAGNPYVGIIRAYPFPWRTDVVLKHTANPLVSIGPQTYVETEIEEIAEVFEGQGNTSSPIYSLTSVQWIAVDLGGIAFESDSRNFTVTGTLKNSIARIKYKSRSLVYDVVAPNADPAQFLLESQIS